ncbi:MAG: hypothetical protein HY300_16325 [Verrucomicrobia bacterium]|nr:hypothetical protein [Verrucomicrobiota bacterium]
MKFSVLGALFAIACVVPANAAEPRPLLHAHAHNDYEHARPLFDALEQGFCSVEADVWLVNGQLLVAHDKDKAQPERTLQSLYLDPLRERVKRNEGRVFRNGPECSLLIDVKSEAEPTWAALREVLRNYADILTAFRGDVVATNAVRVIVSGNRARDAIRAEPVRLAAYDGRLDDLGANEPRHFIAWISDNWTKQFKWRGEGMCPDDERAKLREIVAKAHSQDCRIRLWATPEKSVVWKELRDAGVDIINTDDLAGLRKFFADE